MGNFDSEKFMKHTHAALCMLFSFVHELVVNTNTNVYQRRGISRETRRKKLLRDHLFDDFLGIAWWLEVCNENYLTFSETNLWEIQKKTLKKKKVARKFFKWNQRKRNEILKLYFTLDRFRLQFSGKRRKKCGKHEMDRNYFNHMRKLLSESNIKLSSRQKINFRNFLYWLINDLWSDFLEQNWIYFSSVN